MSGGTEIPHVSGALRPTGRLGAVTGAVLLLLAFAYFTLSILAAPDAATVGQAAAPWPDGPEYLDGAVSLARGDGYRIHLAGELHPPRFPPGYSVVVAGLIRLGVAAERAPLRANQAAGLLLLIAACAPLARRREWLPAGLAALLLATLPAFVVLCRAPLSEPTGTLVVVAAVGLLLAREPGARGWRLGVGGFLLGLGLGFRTGNFLFLAFLPAAVLGRGPWSLPAARRLARVTLAFLVGAAPIFAYDLTTFDHPFAGGYSYWLPAEAVHSTFGLGYFGANLRTYAAEIFFGPRLYSVSNLYGTGSYLGPAFALLLLVAPLGLRRDRRFWGATLAGVAYVGAMLFYFLADGRLLFPVLVLAVPAVACGVTRLAVGAAGVIRSGSRLRPLAKVVGVAVVALTAAAAAGWPSSAGNLDSVELIRAASRKTFVPAYRVAHQLVRLHPPGRVVVVSDIPSPYLHAQLPESAVVAPLLAEHGHRFNPAVFRFGRIERTALVATSLEREVPVWAVTHSLPVLGLAAVTPAPPGYAWEVMAIDRDSGSAKTPWPALAGGGIARLVREGQGARPTRSTPAVPP